MKIPTLANYSCTLKNIRFNQNFKNSTYVDNRQISFRANNPYDLNYYEHGKNSGVSCYNGNHSYRPDLAIPTCKACAKLLDLKPNDSILDFGCSFGFYVKGFRTLGYDAKGFDISEYATSMADADTKPYVSTKRPEEKFDCIISKDVLEHVPYEELSETLSYIKNHSKKSLIVVPLADNGKYRVPDNEKDATHIIRENESWWQEQFQNAGLNVKKVLYELPPIKEKQTSAYPTGTAFFLLESKDA